jgi:hypothetical protein
MKIKAAAQVILGIYGSFKKRNSVSIQLEVDGKNLIENCDVAGEFKKYFQAVHNNSR